MVATSHSPEPGPAVLGAEWRRIVVGYRDAASSMPALRSGIALACSQRARLVVVHAGSGPVAVQNGPSAAVANALGNPPWALVHSTVHGLAIPDDTLTIVEPGDPVSVIGRVVRSGDLVVVGKSGRIRWRSTAARLRSALPCPVVEIDGDEIESVSLRPEVDNTVLV